MAQARGGAQVAGCDRGHGFLGSSHDSPFGSSRAAGASRPLRSKFAGGRRTTDMKRASLVLLLFGLLMGIEVPAAGQAAPARTEHRLQFPYRRFDLPEYLATGAVAAGYVYVEFGAKTPRQPRWTGGILFDDDAREALRGSSRSARDRAGVISDYLTLAPQGLAFFDTLGVPLLFDHWNVDVAWQMTAMNLQVMAVTGLIARSGHRFVARERPDTKPCIENHEYGALCFGGPTRAFQADTPRRPSRGRRWCACIT